MDIDLRTKLLARMTAVHVISAPCQGAYSVSQAIGIEVDESPSGW